MARTKDMLTNLSLQDLNTVPKNITPFEAYCLHRLMTGKPLDGRYINILKEKKILSEDGKTVTVFGKIVHTNYLKSRGQRGSASG